MTQRSHGFLKDGATYTPIDVPGATGHPSLRDQRWWPDRGELQDGTGIHGFLTDGTTFTPIDVPGARVPSLGINNRGQIVGLFSDGSGAMAL